MLSACTSASFGRPSPTYTAEATPTATPIRAAPTAGLTATAIPPTLGPNAAKWMQVSSLGGSKGMQAMFDVWYGGKELTSEQEDYLRQLFRMQPLGQMDFNVWLKQTLRRVYENAVKEGYKAGQ